MNRIKLVNFLESYGDGIHGTPNYENNGEYCFINGNNLRDDRILLNDTNRISKEEYIRIKRPIYTNSLLLSINGTLGNVAKYNGEKIALGKSVCYLNIKRDYNRDFFFYLIKTKEFQTYIQLVAHGSTIKNLAPSQVAQYEFEMPKNINKLSDTLSLIDSKISLNNKIISELESMAKTIYDYWFLQFEFPNEEGKPYKSSGGKMIWNEELKREIPEGWEVKSLEEFGELNNGINYDKNALGDKAYRIVNIRNISDSSILLNKFNLDEICLTSKFADKYLIKNDDILIARSGIPGAVRLFQSNFENTIFCGFIIRFHINIPLYKNAIFYKLKKYESTNATTSGGTIMQNVSQDTLKRLKFEIPELSILKKFNQIIDIIHSSIDKISNENQELTSLRDFLLPLLMNGQVGFKEVTK